MVSAEWHRPPLDKVMELFVFFCWVISFQYTFSRSGNSMVRLSVLYHHRLTSKIQFDPEILEPSRLPIFFPDGILWYHLYLCFRGRGIQWWHVQNSTTTGWPRKPRFNRKYWNFKGYPSFSLVEFYDITYIYVFEVEEFNGDTFRILRLPVDFENPGLTGNTGTSRLPIFFPGGILWYHLYLCFRGRGIQWWHVQNSTTTGWPRKSRFNRKYWNFEVTHLFPWWNFMISPIFMFSRSRNSMVTRSEFYDYRLTSKIQV